MHLIFALLLCVDATKKAPKLAVNNWLQHKTLGSGNHASPQLKHAAAKAVVTFRKLLREKVIVKGEEWKARFANADKFGGAVVQCVSLLFGVCYRTIKRAATFLKERSAHATLPEPKTRGKTKMTVEEYQAHYGNAYNAITFHLSNAKKNGETMDVDKLLEALRKEEPQVYHAMEIGYEALRYYLRRLGFKHGRISRRLATQRNKEYILAWLIAYLGGGFQIKNSLYFFFSISILLFC